MQYSPAPEADQAQGIQADITFCNYTEADPSKWEDRHIDIIEEYVTCFGEKDLLFSTPRRGEISGIMNGIGEKFNIPDLMSDIMEGRISLLPDASQTEEVSTEEREIIDKISSTASSSTTCFMARLRILALESLKEKNVAEYELKKGLWLQNYERIKYIFELRTMKVLSPPVFLCISQDTSHENNSIKTIYDRTTEHINHMYRDLYFVTVSAEGGYQKQSFLQRWLADDSKKTFATCSFDPKGTIPGNFNTFFGFRAESLPPVINTQQANQHMQMILNHIKEIYCNNNEVHADYMFKWLANIIKYPWKKTEVLMLIFGIEGCGKGMIIDFFANKVLGQHLSFQTATPGVDLFSKFAIGAHRKLLCFCDEAGEDLSKHHDQLKNLITTKTIRIEKKGQDIRTEDNYTNVIVASNNAGPVKISPYDRRVVAFQCDEKYKENYNYFASLSIATRSDECAKAVYEFLLHYDLPEDYNFQALRPITKYYESLQVASLPIFLRFVSFKCNTFHSTGSSSSENSVWKVQARTLFREFTEWRKERGYENPYTEVKFGRELNELASVDGSGMRRIKCNTVFYEIQFEALQRYLIRKKKFDENAF